MLDLSFVLNVLLETLLELVLEIFNPRVRRHQMLRQEWLCVVYRILPAKNIRILVVNIMARRANSLFGSIRCATCRRATCRINTFLLWRTHNILATRTVFINSDFGLHEFVIYSARGRWCTTSTLRLIAPKAEYLLIANGFCRSRMLYRNKGMATTRTISLRVYLSAILLGSVHWLPDRDHTIVEHGLILLTVLHLMMIIRVSKGVWRPWSNTILLLIIGISTIFYINIAIVWRLAYASKFLLLLFREEHVGNDAATTAVGVVLLIVRPSGLLHMLDAVIFSLSLPIISQCISTLSVNLLFLFRISRR